MGYVRFWPRAEVSLGADLTTALHGEAAGRKNRVIISAVDPKTDGLNINPNAIVVAQQIKNKRQNFA